MYRVGSGFAGIGGMDLAAEAAGFETAWQIERDPFCQRVLKRRFPHATLYGDIYECHNLDYVDVAMFGFPCQPFSVAGKRQGDKDPRFLIPEMMRVIAEVKPRVVLLENVPGFPSLAHGSALKQLLRALADLRYDAEWGHLRASDVGAPHRRERWFLVAYTAGVVGSQRRLVESNGRQNEAQQARMGGFAVADARGVGHSERLDLAHSTPATAEPYERTLLANSGGDVVNAGRPRLERRRFSSGVQAQQLGADCACAVSADNAAALGNAQCSGFSGDARGRAGAVAENGHARDGRQVEPRVRRVADGLSAWLDQPRWPARPGEPQHAWEAPRVVADAPYRTTRLKALGNACVPQQVYPLLVAIREWLEAEDQKQDRAQSTEAA